MIRTFWLVLAGVLVLCAQSLAQPGDRSAPEEKTIFLVRHAERTDTGSATPAPPGADPSLSEAGRQRAQSLALMLRDARITTIFVTEYKRTQETAAPLAKAIGIMPRTIVSKDVPALVTQLKEAAGNALVVGHSNSVPEVIKALGVARPVTIADLEFDHLFIVTPQTGKLLQLRYR